MCVCVCFYVRKCICMCEHLQEFLVSVSFAHSPPFSIYQSFFSSSIFFLTLLLPCTAWRPWAWFPIMGPAVSPLSYLLEMLPLLVSWADSRTQRCDVLPRCREGFIHLVAAGVLARPNLLTNLVDGAQVRVVHQLHEVPVPKLLIGHWGTTSAAGVKSDRGVGG